MLDQQILARGPATMPTIVIPVHIPMHRATAASILAGAVPAVPAQPTLRAVLGTLLAVLRARVAPARHAVTRRPSAITVKAWLGGIATGAILATIITASILIGVNG